MGMDVEYNIPETPIPARYLSSSRVMFQRGVHKEGGGESRGLDSDDTSDKGDEGGQNDSEFDVYRAGGGEVDVDEDKEMADPGEEDSSIHSAEPDESEGDCVEETVTARKRGREEVEDSPGKPRGIGRRKKAMVVLDSDSSDDEEDAGTSEHLVYGVTLSEKQSRPKSAKVNVFDGFLGVLTWD